MKDREIIPLLHQINHPTFFTRDSDFYYLRLCHLNGEKSMSNVKASTHTTEELRPEYDFQGGVRGKHAKAMEAGYTITIHQDDGTTTVQTVEPRQGTVILEPDVLAYFPDSAAVNHALRTLITLFPDRQPVIKT